MRDLLNYKPVFSIISFALLLLALPLLLFLSIMLTPLNSASLETWSASNFTTSDHSTYSLPLSAEQELPQRPAEPPRPCPAPAPSPQILTGDAKDGANSKRVISWRGMQLEKLETNLGKARSSIREAATTSLEAAHDEDPEYVPRGNIYRNARAFHRSYLLMEKLFKMYVYEEGEVPLFHEGPSLSVYSIEGRFIHQMETGNLFRTKNPDEALVYFLPISIVRMVQYVYVPDSHDRGPMKNAIIDYIKVIQNKHPFWNRSLGADHSMLSCHDWAPITSSFVPHLFQNSIRVLCNANTSEGFNPSKDASLPEISLRAGEPLVLGGQRHSKRTLLAFFAGRVNGHIRYLLVNEWKGKDQDVQVYAKLPTGVYDQKMKSSKFCLCPSGFEVASPRIVEAIYAECVPVLISDAFVPPFNDVLNWKSFSIEIPVKNISDIKTILMGISQRQYLKMLRNVILVRRHFLLNVPPKRYDVFHMIIHSIWLRRLNIHIQDSDLSS